MGENALKRGIDKPSVSFSYFLLRRLLSTKLALFIHFYEIHDYNFYSLSLENQIRNPLQSSSLHAFQVNKKQYFLGKTFLGICLNDTYFLGFLRPCAAESSSLIIFLWNDSLL